MLFLWRMSRLKKRHRVLDPFGLYLLKRFQYYILVELGFPSKLSQLICSYLEEGIFEKIRLRIQNYYQKSVHRYPVYTEQVEQQPLGSSESGLRSLYNAARFLSGISCLEKTSKKSRLPRFEDFKQWVNHRFQNTTAHLSPTELAKILKLMADDTTFFLNFGPNLKEMERTAEMPAYTIIHSGNLPMDQLQLAANLYGLWQRPHIITLHCIFLGTIVIGTFSF